MYPDDPVRAWKDSELRESPEHPAHPAGEIELNLPGALSQGQATFTCTFIICTWTRPCNPSNFFSCSGGCL